MASSRYTLKTKDTGPPLISVLSDVNGVIDLTEAFSVTFIMRLQGEPPGLPIEIKAEVIAAKEGKVRVRWTALNTSVAGTYQFEYKILWKTGEVDSAPNIGYELLQIVETL